MENSSSIPQTMIDALSGHIASCFSEAVDHKRDTTERLLACYRQRKGIYDNRTKQLIAQAGHQEIFMMLTDIKCRAAEAWIKDVMQNHNESTWALNPTAEPELPPTSGEEIQAIVMQEAAMVAAMGMAVEPETMEMRRLEILEEAETRIKEEALRKCKRMETRITDKMQEGRWRVSLGESIYDFVTYPAVIVKGPVLRKKPRMKWGPNNQPVVVEQVVMDIERVSPFDIFPGPSAVSIQDSYLIHRQRLTRSALKKMKGMAGVRDEAISRVLDQHPSGYRTVQDGDSERDRLIGQDNQGSPDGLYEALEYWGPASGQMLIEWGMAEHNGKPIDPEEEYQINAWKVSNETIKAVINPDPMSRRPYSKACFDEIPGSFWGIALPELMKDVQLMCNASARALAANMGIASGPQVEVHTDRIPDGVPLTTMYPFKMWPTKSDRSGNGQPAIRFFQPDLNAEKLLAIYSHFARQADEVTGVPNYIYGSSAVSGAGRTASGLSMLMENAAKGIKHAILALDAAHSEIVTRIYEHLMIHDPDQSIKGDMQVVAAGAIGALIREQQITARREFMAETLNPVDVQIIGTGGRAYMLRETAKTLFPDINKVVPDPEKMARMQAMQQAMATAVPGQPPGQAPGQPPGPPQPAQPPQQMPA